jgi:hypothetical protein
MITETIKEAERAILELSKYDWNSDLMLFINKLQKDALKSQSGYKFITTNEA